MAAEHTRVDRPVSVPTAETVIGGKYRLVRPLASGGMGAVWIAEHLQLRERVAVKLMMEGLAFSTEAHMRFEREAMAVAHLQRRTMHVVRILDYGIEQGRPFIAMELLEGESLSERLHREGSLPLDQAVAVAAQIARALRAGEQAGIVHRDLKPGNVFVARTDDKEIVKVLDFGLAKGPGLIVPGMNTQTGTLLGSPHYMSPEQVRGEREIDHRSDLWSLAVIVFRMVTGELAFRGNHVGDLLVKICADPLPRATDVSSDLPPAIDGFFERAFQRDREARFDTAYELVEALAKAAGLPIPRELDARSSITSGDFAAHRASEPPPTAPTPVNPEEATSREGTVYAEPAAWATADAPSSQSVPTVPKAFVPASRVGAERAGAALPGRGVWIAVATIVALLLLLVLVLGRSGEAKRPGDLAAPPRTDGPAHASATADAPPVGANQQALPLAEWDSVAPPGTGTAPPAARGSAPPAEPTGRAAAADAATSRPSGPRPRDSVFGF